MIATLVEEIKKRVSYPLSALDVFGRDGSWEIHKYAELVNQLSIWEINSDFEEPLRRHFPKANIVIGDSHKLIGTTDKKYDLIVIDNFFTSGAHVEHFDLFPDVLWLLNEPGFLVLNLFTIPHAYRKEIPEVVLNQRKKFYGKNEITASEGIDIYKKIVSELNKVITWTALAPRRPGLLYLAMEIVKKS